MIGCGQRDSTATACAFIATSRDPLPAPSRKSAATSAGRDGASTGSGSAAKKSAALVRTTVRLPKRAVARPERGMPTRAPTAMASSAAPSTLGERSSDACTMGMCGTQVAKPAPLAKKMAATAPRVRREGTCMDGSMPAALTRVASYTVCALASRGTSD